MERQFTTARAPSSTLTRSWCHARSTPRTGADCTASCFRMCTSGPVSTAPWAWARAAGCRQVSWPHCLQAAAWGRPARGRARIRYASGTQSPELLVDCAPFGNGAVVVEHSPAWDGLTVGLASDVVGKDGHCVTCEDFARTPLPAENATSRSARRAEAAHAMPHRRRTTRTGAPPATSCNHRQCSERDQTSATSADDPN